MVTLRFVGWQYSYSMTHYKSVYTPKKTSEPWGQLIFSSASHVKFSSHEVDVSCALFRILHVDDELWPSWSSNRYLRWKTTWNDNATSVDETLKKIWTANLWRGSFRYEMPQKNGLDFLKELRDQNNQIPLILFTEKRQRRCSVKSFEFRRWPLHQQKWFARNSLLRISGRNKKDCWTQKSRELLAKSESKYHALVENSLQGNAILIADPFRLVFANGAFGKI